MSWQSFSIDRYEAYPVALNTLGFPDLYGYIRLYWEGHQRATLWFYRDNAATVHSNLALPSPTGLIKYSAAFTQAQFDDAVDLLRNERPVFFRWNDTTNGAMLATAGEPVGEAERIARIHVDVPEGIEGFSGYQPVTFGIPFARGKVPQGVGVVVLDADGTTVPAQLEVLATWDPPGTGSAVSIKWLLVDLLVHIADGVPQELYLAVDQSVVLPLGAAPPLVSSDPVPVDTGPTQFVIGHSAGLLGTFRLTTDSDVFTAGVDPFDVVVEKSGPIRTVLKVDTDYKNSTGEVIARSSTRFRFWQGLPIVKIYHTVIWESDDSDQIVDLRFTRAVDNAATAEIGYTSEGAFENSLYSTGRQTAYNKTEWDGGPEDTGKLDGWIDVAGGAGGPVFLGLRWPWQQFPVGFAHDAGTVSVLMIGPSPSSPMSLAPTDVAPAHVRDVQPDPSQQNSEYSGGGYGWETLSPDRTASDRADPALISPRGIARTYEITLWLGDASVPAVIKNAFVQHPVFAYVDPVVAVEAGLPSPATVAGVGPYAELEAAIERVFGFVSKDAAGEAERAGDDDFGTWNWGDVQWQWSGYAYVTYRYWMCNGKGWSVVPWILFLRSGDRRYLEHGEANSRHVMDVDTCHVQDTGQFADDMPPPAPDWKFRGGVYSYSEIHWSFGPVHEDREGITGDSEYLLYCYYVTGYERARDVIRERVEAVHGSRWGVLDGALQTYYPKNATIVTTATRYLYVMLSELCLLYEASWNDPSVTPSLVSELHDWAIATLDTVKFAIDQSGAHWFPGITSNHYLSHPLLLAARVLGSTEALTRLEQWEAYLGSGLRAGYGGAALGPMSIWSLAAIQSSKQDPNVAIEIDATLRARADTILRTTPSGGKTFVGMGPYDAQEAGPYLRDFVTGIWSLVSVPPPIDVRRRPPVGYFGAQLAVNGGYRQIAFVKKPAGLAPITLSVHFDGYNATTAMYDVVVNLLGPTGLVTEIDFTFEVTYDHTFGIESVQLTLPTETAGEIYAIDAIVPPVPGTDWSLPISVRTSPACPVVYYAPLDPAIMSIASPAYGGEFWLRPQQAGTAVTMASFNNPQRGRAIMLDASGTQVAESEFEDPLYETIAFTPADTSLYAIVVGAVAIRQDYRFGGIRPYLSRAAGEWFDPSVEAAELVAALSLPNT